MTRRTCTKSCRHVEICLHLPAERCSRAGAVLFCNKAERYLHSVFSPIDPLSALPEAIECCFSAAKRLTTDVAIGDEAKALILTA